MLKTTNQNEYWWIVLWEPFQNLYLAIIFVSYCSVMKLPQTYRLKVTLLAHSCVGQETCMARFSAQGGQGWTRHYPGLFSSRWSGRGSLLSSLFILARSSSLWLLLRSLFSSCPSVIPLSLYRPFAFHLMWPSPSLSQQWCIRMFLVLCMSDLFCSQLEKLLLKVLTWFDQACPE